MMNNKSMAYMVFAIAIGYLLISTVPGQVETLVSPKLSSQGEQENFALDSSESDAEPKIENGEKRGEASEEIAAAEAQSDANETTPSAGLGDEVMEEPVARPGETLVPLYRWWIVDLFIAFGVYYVARRLLT
jgi:hypothetical protein